MSERARATPPETQSPAAPESTPLDSGADLSSVAAEIRARKERSDKGKPRGPRGSKAAAAEPGEVSDSVLTTQLGALLRALFSFGGIVAKWYGYEQHEELTDEETAEGAGYFLALARKFPWLAALSVWSAGPVWLLTMVVRKFRRTPPPAPRANAPEPPPARIAS